MVKIRRLLSINYYKKYSIMQWQEEKKRYLAMGSQEENLQKSVKWNTIPSWKEYSQSNELLPKIELPIGASIDESLNTTLADKIAIFTGDITHLEVDAIVNAANNSLCGGSGVDGAIHKAAGPLLLKECITLNGCETGQAKITGGYELPAKYVIHTVGPTNKSSSLLKNCYVNSLKLALANNLRTIAFPCISTGVYGYPNENAAHVASNAVRMFLEEHAEKIDRVIFCLFLEIDQKFYEGVLQSYFPIK